MEGCGLSGAGDLISIKMCRYANPNLRLFGKTTRATERLWFFAFSVSVDNSFVSSPVRGCFEHSTGFICSTPCIVV
jgi:hypothetical protein